MSRKGVDQITDRQFRRARTNQRLVTAYPDSL